MIKSHLSIPHQIDVQQNVLEYVGVFKCLEIFYLFSTFVRHNAA